MPVTEAEVAWAAGLFEGEGCISLERRGEKYAYPSLEVNMTDEDVLRRFWDIVGEGSFTGPHRPRRLNHQPYWRWRVTGDAFRPTLLLLLPHLGERRSAKALEVLGNSSAPKYHPRRSHYRKFVQLLLFN